MQNLCFELECNISRYRTFEKKVSLRTHLIYFIRPKMMLESVSEHFVNLRHEKLCRTSVSGQNALFRGTELSKKVSQRRLPIYSNRPKMMFGSISEHFADLRHEKRCKTCVLGQNAQFWVPNSQKKFRYEGTQSTPLDPK